MIPDRILSTELDGLRELEESIKSIKLQEPQYCTLEGSEIRWLESPTSKSEFHKVPGVSQKLHPKTTSETSTSNEPEDRQVPEIYPGKMPRTMSEMFTSTELETSKIPDVAEMCQIPKITFETSISKKTEDPEVAEIRRTHSMSKISDKTEEPEIPKIRRMQSTIVEIPISISSKFSDEFNIEDVKANEMRATSEMSSKFGDKTEFMENYNEVSKIITKLENDSLRDMILANQKSTGKIKLHTMDEVSFLFKSSLSIEDIIK